VKRNAAANINARRRYAERLREFGHLYAPPDPGDICAYCDGKGGSSDHVPPPAAFAKLSEAERIAASPRLVRSCSRCNVRLRHCASWSIPDRRAYVAEALARGPVPRPVLSPRKPRGPDLKPRVLPPPLVETGNWLVRMNGWRNAYAIYHRPRRGADFECLEFASTRLALLHRLFLLDAPQAFMKACEALPARAGLPDDL